MTDRKPTANPEAPQHGVAGPSEPTDYIIEDALYAKGKKVVCCPSNESGFKTRAMCIAEHVGGRWVHRSHGYVMSPQQAKRFVEEFSK